MMDGEEFFKNVDRPGASEDGVLCSRKSSAAEEFSYSSARPVWLQWPMEKRQCFLLEFKRTPEEYRQCHTNEPTLAACRRCLYAAGYNTQLDTRAKVFLHPDHSDSGGQRATNHADSTRKHRTGRALRSKSLLGRAPSPLWPLEIAARACCEATWHSKSPLEHEPGARSHHMDNCENTVSSVGL